MIPLQRFPPITQHLSSILLSHILALTIGLLSLFNLVDAWYPQPAYGQGDWFQRAHTLKIGRGRPSQSQPYQCKPLPSKIGILEGFGVWNRKNEPAILGVALYPDSICQELPIATIILDIAALRGFHVANFKNINDWDFGVQAYIKMMNVRGFQGIRVDDESVEGRSLSGLLGTSGQDLSGSIVWWYHDANGMSRRRQIQRNVVQWVNLLAYEHVPNDKIHRLMREVVERVINHPIDIRLSNSLQLMVGVNKDAYIKGNQLYSPVLGIDTPYQNLRLQIDDSYYPSGSRDDVESKALNSKLAAESDEEAALRFSGPLFNQILQNPDTSVLEPTDIVEGPNTDPRRSSKAQPRLRKGSQTVDSNLQLKSTGQNRDVVPGLNVGSTLSSQIPPNSMMNHTNQPGGSTLMDFTDPQTVANRPLPLEALHASFERFQNKEKWLALIEAQMKFHVRMYEAALEKYSKYTQEQNLVSENFNADLLFDPDQIQVEEPRPDSSTEAVIAGGKAGLFENLETDLPKQGEARFQDFGSEYDPLDFDVYEDFDPSYARIVKRLKKNT